LGSRADRHVATLTEPLTLRTEPSPSPTSMARCGVCVVNGLQSAGLGAICGRFSVVSSMNVPGGSPAARYQPKYGFCVPLPPFQRPSVPS